MPEIDPLGNSGSTMVMFGTGSSYRTEDRDPNNPPNVNLGPQLIVAVKDDGTANAAVDITALDARVDSNAALAAVSNPNLSGTSTSASATPPRHGWQMPLSNAGERVVVNPFQIKTTLLVVSNRPASDPCGFGGDSRIFALNPETGLAPSHGVFDTNADGTINGADAGYNVLSVPNQVISLPAFQSTQAVAPNNSSSGIADNTVWSESRGQTAALAGGVTAGQDASKTNCVQTALFGKSATGVGNVLMRVCNSASSRVTWRQLK